MTSGAAVPLTGGGKSGITGAGAVAAASPAVAGAAGEAPSSGEAAGGSSPGSLSAASLSCGKLSGAAAPEPGSSLCSAGAESIPASSASVVNRFITSHPPAPFSPLLPDCAGYDGFSTSARTVRTRSVKW